MWLVPMGDHKDQKQKFAHETELAHAGLVTLLEDLLAGIRSGELLLEHGTQSVSLSPSGQFKIGIEAKHKPGRESLCIELGWELPTPTLRVGAVADPPSIGVRRRPVVALRQARRNEVEAEAGDSATEAGPAVEVEITAEGLARLPKERLLALAKAVGLDGRSQLPKSSLARALSEHDVRPHLDDEDLRLLASR
jgi:amphi-Trp domain-containing protein